MRSDIRLECLKLTRLEAIQNPDVDLWIERARQLEAYVVDGEGQALDAPPAKRRGRPPKARTDNPDGPDSSAHLSDLASNDPVRPAA
jgi:hypothetical protein